MEKRAVKTVKAVIRHFISSANSAGYFFNITDFFDQKACMRDRNKIANHRLHRFYRPGEFAA